MICEEVLHIDDSQIVDVYVDGLSVTAYMFGGTSAQPMEMGGEEPGLFDVTMQVQDVAMTFLIRSHLVEWYQESLPVQVIVWEDGSAQFKELLNGKALRISWDG